MFKIGLLYLSVFYFLQTSSNEVLKKIDDDNGSSIECTNSGFKCANSCTTLIRCIPIGNGTYAKHVARKCPLEIGKLCSTITLDCDSSYCDDPNLDKQEINCHEDGLYPNPNNCSSYFTCSNGVRKDFECGIDEAFDGAQGNCTKKTLNFRPCVQRPIPRCRKITDVGPYPENSSIYYVCSYNSYGYLIPELRTCSKGYNFDSEEEKCSSSSTIMISWIIIAFALYIPLLR